MLPNKRPFHTTLFAAGVLSRFPAWMKLQEKTSYAYRMEEAILGNELELFNRTMNVYKDYSFINRSPIDATEYLSKIELPYFLKDTTITDKNNIPIHVVKDSFQFLGNAPTRCSFKLPTIQPSGLEGYDITGVEYIAGFPSGTLVVKTSKSDIEPSSLLYYHLNTIYNTIDVFPYSGVALGIGDAGIENGSFDPGIPESEWSLKKKYPMNVWQSFDSSGNLVESATMPSGINWQYMSYIDPDTELKTYYHKALNNPYGSGIYTKADVTLSAVPISGTLVVRDVYNLTSGVPTVIPSSGLNYYSYVWVSGNFERDQWIYKGFENPIPIEQTPISLQNIILATSGTLPIVPDYAGTISWSQLREGGYLDDEVYPHSGTFSWIDGTGALSNIVRFSGAFSKYDMTYQYQMFSGITQISSDPRIEASRVSPSGAQVFFIQGSDFYAPIAFETSHSNSNAVRIDPYDVRPGTTVYYTAQVNTFIKDTWLNATTQNKTIQFYNHNIGYSDELGIRNG